MTDWARHWERFPLQFAPTDFLRQVGKTLGGVPISERQVERIVAGIHEALQLRDEDVVLDLCCGNGLLTERIARSCRSVVGVDYSSSLLAVAERHHRPANVSYRLLSALDLDRLRPAPPILFTKVLVYEALQHFHPRALGRLLEGIGGVTTPDARVLLGSVPDRALRRRFHDTPRRRLIALMRRLAGRDAIGTWWDREVLRSVLERSGWNCVFMDQPPELHTAHYRFDLAAERIPTGWRGKVER